MSTADWNDDNEAALNMKRAADGVNFKKAALPEERENDDSGHERSQAMAALEPEIQKQDMSDSQGGKQTSALSADEVDDDETANESPASASQSADFASLFQRHRIDPAMIKETSQEKLDLWYRLLVPRDETQIREAHQELVKKRQYSRERQQRMNQPQRRYFDDTIPGSADEGLSTSLVGSEPELQLRVEEREKPSSKCDRPDLLHQVVAPNDVRLPSTQSPQSLSSRQQELDVSLTDQADHVVHAVGHHRESRSAHLQQDERDTRIFEAARLDLIVRTWNCQRKVPETLRHAVGADSWLEFADKIVGLEKTKKGEECTRQMSKLKAGHKAEIQTIQERLERAEAHEAHVVRLGIKHIKEKQDALTVAEHKIQQLLENTRLQKGGSEDLRTQLREAKKEVRELRQTVNIFLQRQEEAEEAEEIRAAIADQNISTSQLNQQTADVAQETWKFLEHENECHGSEYKFSVPDIGYLHGILKKTVTFRDFSSRLVSPPFNCHFKIRDLAFWLLESDATRDTTIIAHWASASDKDGNRSDWWEELVKVKAEGQRMAKQNKILEAEKTGKVSQLEQCRMELAEQTRRFQEIAQNSRRVQEAVGRTSEAGVQLKGVEKRIEACEPIAPLSQDGTTQTEDRLRLLSKLRYEFESLRTEIEDLRSIGEQLREAFLGSFRSESQQNTGFELTGIREKNKDLQGKVRSLENKLSQQQAQFAQVLTEDRAETERQVARLEERLKVVMGTRQRLADQFDDLLQDYNKAHDPAIRVDQQGAELKKCFHELRAADRECRNLEARLENSETGDSSKVKRIAELEQEIHMHVRQLSWLGQQHDALIIEVERYQEIRRVDRKEIGRLQEALESENRRSQRTQEILKQKEKELDESMRHSTAEVQRLAAEQRRKLAELRIAVQEQRKREEQRRPDQLAASNLTLKRQQVEGEVIDSKYGIYMTRERREALERVRREHREAKNSWLNAMAEPSKR